MLGPLRRYIKSYALRTGRMRSLFLRFGRPSADEYTDFMRRHGGLHAVGDHVMILTDTTITDPAYVRIGNNVVLSSCALIGHDGSTAVMDRAFGIRTEVVGKIDIRDNVFIGFGAIVLPGVTIGPNALVAAGSVVNADVLPDSVVAGVPAKRIGSFAELAQTRVAQLDGRPWADLIRNRDLVWDPELEKRLVVMRAATFYPEDTGGAAA